MTRKADNRIELDKISVSRFASLVARSNQSRIGRATQNYLVSKSLLLQRRVEIEERRRLGKDTTRLEKMASRLERSMNAHKRLVTSLSS